MGVLYKRNRKKKGLAMESQMNQDIINKARTDLIYFVNLFFKEISQYRKELIDLFPKDSEGK